MRVWLYQNRDIKVFILLGVLIAIFLIVTTAYYNRDRRTYELNLPQVEELSEIQLKDMVELKCFLHLQFIMMNCYNQDKDMKKFFHVFILLLIEDY